MKWKKSGESRIESETKRPLATNKTLQSASQIRRDEIKSQLPTKELAQVCKDASRNLACVEDVIRIHPILLN